MTRKPTAKKVETKKKAPPYFFAIGRRKTALAKIKLELEGKGEFVVNQRELVNYFPTLALQKTVTDPLNSAGLLKKVKVIAKVAGGGISGQASAVALGLARALVRADAAFKPVLKKQGMLTRDARKKERKKPGLKRARRAPQWQKR